MGVVRSNPAGKLGSSLKKIPGSLPSPAWQLEKGHNLLLRPPCPALSALPALRRGSPPARSSTAAAKDLERSGGGEVTL
jgi:hypothetical protein